jgi:hypothetical protein
LIFAYVRNADPKNLATQVKQSYLGITKHKGESRLMRNLICLGRTRTALVSEQPEPEHLTVTGIAPIPSSEDAFFVSHGPIATNHKIEILRVQVQKRFSPS